MTELTQEMLLALETGSISVVELLQEIDALAKKDSIQAEELLVTLKESTNLSYNILKLNPNPLFIRVGVLFCY